MSWFEGAPLDSPTHRRFIEEMRTASPIWARHGILPEQTSAWSNPELAEIRILGTDEILDISIHAIVGKGRNGFWAHAEWSFHGYVLDGDPGCLYEKTGSFEDLFRTVVTWLDRELGRPLLREEWDRRGNGPAIQWTLKNPAEVMRRDGFSFARLFGHPADRTERVR